MSRWTFVLLAAAIGAPSTAAAQVLPQPIPRVVVDARGFWSGLGQDPVTAAQLGLVAAELPSRALGVVAGVHVYPVRRGRFSIGLGGELIRARGSRTPPVPADPATLPDPAVRQRLDGLSVQATINYGTADGWSYLTGGTGPMRFGTYLGDTAPAEPSLSKSTLNLGGGARWFAKPHVAFTFDMRFYLTRPENQTADYPGRQRNRLLILSAGIAIK